MITLKEFLLEINKNTQFRVFAPNADCLIYESFRVPHITDPGILSTIWDEDFYYTLRKNQRYSPVVLRLSENVLDYETKIFLEKFGDYKVFSIDCSSCPAENIIYNEELDKWQIEKVKPDYERCFDLYIIKEK